MYIKSAPKHTYIHKYIDTYINNIKYSAKYHVTQIIKIKK